MLRWLRVFTVWAQIADVAEVIFHPLLKLVDLLVEHFFEFNRVDLRLCVPVSHDSSLALNRFDRIDRLCVLCANQATLRQIKT